MTDLCRICVSTSSVIREVMTCIQQNGHGIALIVDDDRRLITTITDGDLRTAILNGADLDACASPIILQLKAVSYAQSITASVDTPREELLRLMLTYSIRHIPLVDEAGRVVDLALLSELALETEPVPAAVVMAGGFGTRLRPWTDHLPKPMLPVADKPVIEHIVEQLLTTGVQRVYVTLHYKPEVIMDHFGSGQRHGVEINYLSERQPLGTAGVLRLLEATAVPILVINGDILTHVDFHAMTFFHRDHHADMTVGVRQIEVPISYGVVETDGVFIRGIKEKPVTRFLINAGVYLLEPGVLEYIPAGKRFDMTQLIDRLLGDGGSVVGFPIHEYWLDIGQPSDYQRAIDDARTGAY